MKMDSPINILELIEEDLQANRMRIRFPINQNTELLEIIKQLETSIEDLCLKINDTNIKRIQSLIIKGNWSNFIENEFGWRL